MVQNEGLPVRHNPGQRSATCLVQTGFTKSVKADDRGPERTISRPDEISRCKTSDSLFETSSRLFCTKQEFQTDRLFGLQIK